jgi:thiol-disulfide isomerase/thioredoxin
VGCRVGAGQQYQTIKEVEKMDSDDKVSIEHKQGEAILLDFWATWCPPCQAPMAHNQSMLDKHKDDQLWKDKVRIIGLSIDQDKNKLKSHVESKEWSSPEHFFRAGSNASDVYGVRGVPHVMLIDGNGTIVFKGHPANRKDLEADLTALAEGKELEGEGIVKAQPEGDGAPKKLEVEEGFKELNCDTTSEIEEFKKVAGSI